jgi:hypothetical protein
MSLEKTPTAKQSLDQSVAAALDSFASLERELPLVESLIVLGGGIDQVTTRNVVTGKEEQIWKPSRYVVDVDPHKKEKDKRTGERKPIVPNEVLSESAVVHGGMAHLLGSMQFLEELKERGAPVTQLIFAAGRPDYIESVTHDSSVDEARVMKREFLRRIREHQVIEPDNIIVGSEGSKNTAGDLLNGFNLALEHNPIVDHVVVILTEVRLERTKVMCTYLQEQFPRLKKITVTFISAEDLLRR